MNPSTLSSSPVSTHKTDFYSCAERNEVKAQPFVGTSIDNSSDDSDKSVEDAFRDMQRAMVRWDIFGTFDCAADYTLARAKWLRLKSYSQGNAK